MAEFPESVKNNIKEARFLRTVAGCLVLVVFIIAALVEGCSS